MTVRVATVTVLVGADGQPPRAKPSGAGTHRAWLALRPHPAFPPLTPLRVPAGSACKPRLSGSRLAFPSRSQRAAVRTWWAVQGGGHGSELGAGPLGSRSAVGSGGPCFTCSAVSSWGSRAARGDCADELARRAQGRPGRAGAGPARAGPAAHLPFSSFGSFRRAGHPQACSSGKRLLD